jgi:hypothetical protein
VQETEDTWQDILAGGPCQLMSDSVLKVAGSVPHLVLVIVGINRLVPLLL